MSGRYRRREKALTALTAIVDEFALLEAERAYDIVYVDKDGIQRCGLCDAKLAECECFDDEELAQ